MIAAGLRDPAHEAVRVLGVSRQTVEPRDDDPARLAALDAAQRLVQSGAVELAARLVEVGGQHLADSEAVFLRLGQHGLQAAGVTHFAAGDDEAHGVGTVARRPDGSAPPVRPTSARCGRFA